MTARRRLAWGCAAATMAAAACATYTATNIDAGVDASTPVDPPVTDAGTFDAVADVGDEAPPICIVCGSECCYAGTSKDFCRTGNTCGKCSATAGACKADLDCCDAGKCATDPVGDAGLCRPTCGRKFNVCRNTSECCLGLRCEPNGSLTLCQ